MGIAVEIRVLTSPSAMEPMPMGEFERLPSTSSASGSVPMPPRYTLPLDVLISKTSYYSFISLAQLLRLNLGQKLVTFENTSCMFNTRNCAPDNVVGIVTIDFLLGEQQATHDFLVVREAGAPGLLGQSFIDAEDRELVSSFDTASNCWTLHLASRKSSVDAGDETTASQTEGPPSVLLKAMEINSAVPIPNIFPCDLSRDSSLSSQLSFPANADAIASPRVEHEASKSCNQPPAAAADSIAAGDSPVLVRSSSKSSSASTQLKAQDDHSAPAVSETSTVVPQLQPSQQSHSAYGRMTSAEQREIFPPMLQPLQPLSQNCGFGLPSPSAFSESCPFEYRPTQPAAVQPLYPAIGGLSQSPSSSQPALGRDVDVELLRQLLETVALEQQQRQLQQQNAFLQSALDTQDGQMVERRVLQYLEEEEAKQQFHMPHRMQQSQPTNSYPFNTGLSASWPGKTTNLGFVFDRQQSQEDIFSRQNLANQRHLSNVLQEVLQSRRT